MTSPTLSPSIAAADRIREDAAAAHARIRGDRGLSNEGAQRKMAAAHLDAQSKMDALQKAATAWSQGDHAAAQKAAWGTEGVPGAGSANVALSYRDAQDRAAQLDDPQAASALLDRANSTGDELLARAVAHHAYTQASGPLPSAAWGDVVDNYTSSRPQAAAAVDRLIATTKQPLTARTMFQYALPVPSELAGANPSRIAQLAEQDQ